MTRRARSLGAVLHQRRSTTLNIDFRGSAATFYDLQAQGMKRFKLSDAARIAWSTNGRWINVWSWSVNAPSERALKSKRCCYRNKHSLKFKLQHNNFAHKHILDIFLTESRILTDLNDVETEEAAGRQVCRHSIYALYRLYFAFFWIYLIMRHATRAHQRAHAITAFSPTVA